MPFKNDGSQELKFAGMMDLDSVDTFFLKMAEYEFRQGSKIQINPKFSEKPFELKIKDIMAYGKDSEPK